MKAFRLINASESDYSDLQKIINSDLSRVDSYIACVSVKDKTLVLTNCTKVCQEYAKKGGSYVHIDLDNFESMSI